jgi:hypothetical protein
MWCQCQIGGNFRNLVAPPVQTVSVRLPGSVGRGGRNSREDVVSIQKALNQVGLSAGGPTRLLVVDGICGPLTTAGIGRFQQVQFHGTLNDFRIDQHGKTLGRLNQLSDIDPNIVTSKSSAITDRKKTTDQTSQDQLDIARRLANDADRRITAAMARLLRAQAAIVKVQRTSEEQKLVDEVDWHFKTSAALDPISHLLQISAVFISCQLLSVSQHLGPEIFFVQAFILIPTRLPLQN